MYSRADLLKTKDDLLITKQLQSKNYRVALSHEDVDSEYKECLITTDLHRSVERV